MAPEGLLEDFLGTGDNCGVGSDGSRAQTPVWETSFSSGSTHSLRACLGPCPGGGVGRCEAVSRLRC